MMMSYPQNPIAAILDAIWRAQQFRRQRAEEEEERARQRQRHEEWERIRSEARRVAEEREKYDAMPIGDVLATIGEKPRAGIDPKTPYRFFRIKGIPLASIVEPTVDPRAAALQAIKDAEIVARLTERPVTIPGTILEASGLPFPRLPGPFAPVPGVPEGGIRPPMPGVPEPTYQGPMAPLTIGAPKVAVTLGELGGDAIRPEFRHLPWDPSKPIPDQYIRPEARPEKGETPQARRERVTAQLDKLRDDIRNSISAGDVEGARQAATAFNARLQEAARWGVSVPYSRFNIQSVVSAAQKRAQKIERPPGGAGDTLAALRLRLTQKYLAGQPLTSQEERILFGTAGPADVKRQALYADLAAAHAAADQARLRLASLRRQAVMPQELARAEKAFQDALRRVKEIQARIKTLEQWPGGGKPVDDPDPLGLFK